MIRKTNAFCELVENAINAYTVKVKLHTLWMNYFLVSYETIHAIDKFVLQLLSMYLTDSFIIENYSESFYWFCLIKLLLGLWIAA